ncbi:MAG: bifunctional DNA primase/polymerase [Candidatus Methanoperedens sp.]
MSIVTPDTIEAMKKEVEENIHEFVYHALIPPDTLKTQDNSPGKQPIETNWSKLKETPKQTINKIEQGYNLGTVCGKASNITVLDFDNFLFLEEIFKGFDLETLRSKRTEGRGHVYFRYNPNLKASKHHDLGIEVLSDGNNVVVPPSIHASGDVYRWNNPDAPIIEMPTAVEDNLNALFKTEAELKQFISKCRTCFKSIFKDKKDMHGAEGREYMLAVSTDLKAAGAAEQHIKMFAKLVYEKEYDEQRTLNEWRNIDSMKTWRCNTLKIKLPAYVDASKCEKCEQQHDEEKKKPRHEKKKLQSGDEKEVIKFTSFLKISDTELVEEIYDNILSAKFVIWNDGKIEYVNEIQHHGVTYKPLVNEAINTGAVKLPSGVKEYGTTSDLIEEIQKHIYTYLDVSKDMVLFSAWYILLSWVFDRVNTLPYLRAMGDTGCGKSRFLDVIGASCYKACMVSGAITPAPIYRMIKQWGGTIVLDEADFRDSSEKSEVVTILNCGFEKNRPVIRCDQNNVDTLQFLPTYCPKVIATRYAFEDKALESRCLTEKMTQTDRKNIPRVLPVKFYQDQQELRNKLLMFRFRYYHQINGDAGQGLDFGSIEPRLQQATQSFASLFSQIPELMERFKAFIEQYNRDLIEDRSESFDGIIVRALIKLHEDGSKSISGKDIATKMIVDFGLEKATPQAVGKHLKSLKIETERKGHTNLRTVKWDEKHIQKLKNRYVLGEVRQVAISTKSNGALGTLDTDTDLKNETTTAPSVPSAPCIVGESAHLTQDTDTQVRLSMQDIGHQINDMLSEFYGNSRPSKEGFEWLNQEIQSKYDLPEEIARRYLTDAMKVKGW